MKPALTLNNNNNTTFPATLVITSIKVIALIVVSLITFSLKAKCADSTHIISKNAVYITVAGQANTRSLNYERIVRQGRTLSYTLSAGFSLFTENVSTPVSVNAFTTGSKHHFEIGVAAIPYFKHHYYTKGKVDIDKQLYIKPAVGYRYQKSGSGLFVKASVGPQLLIDPPAYNVMAYKVTVIKPSAQFSMGIAF